jgi:nucleoid-associated protein YgaU
MMTASKAVVAFCVLAVGGTALVIGPAELRRLLPGGANTEVAVAARPENRPGAKVDIQVAARIEPKVEPQAEAKVAPNAEPKVEPKAEVKAEPKPAEPKLAAAAPPAPAASPQPAAAPAPAAALAETEKQLSAALGDLAPVKAQPAATDSGPRFDVARVDEHGEAAVIAGQAAPGAKVELLRNGQPLDAVVADAAGQFVMTPPKLPAGSYELTLRAKSPDGTVTQSSRTMPVTVAEATLPPVRVAPPAARAGTKTVERPAETPDVVAALPSASPRLASAPARPRSVVAARPRLMTRPAAATTAVATPADVFNTTPVQAGGSRVISRGDSLWTLSRLAYGDGARYAVIFNANRDKIQNPNLIYPGQTVMLPQKVQ